MGGFLVVFVVSHIQRKKGLPRCCGVFPSLGAPPRKASRLEMDERE